MMFVYVFPSVGIYNMRGTAPAIQMYEFIYYRKLFGVGASQLSEEEVQAGGGDLGDTAKW